MLTRRQRKLIVTLATLLVAVVISLAKGEPSLIGIRSSAAASAAYSTSSYPVTHVVDGDTIDIQKDGAKVRLRLIGINSPESVDPRRPVECFGKEASKHAASLLTGKSVTVETDSSQGMLDKYGRTLAYIFLPDGTSFNRQMISDGYAYEYTYNKPYRYQQQFKDAQQAARLSERGLWASTTCSGMK